MASESNSEERKSFAYKLVQAFPNLPLFTLALWLGWSFIAYHSTIWLSDTEINGVNLSILYIVSTISFGIAAVLSAQSTEKMRGLLQKQPYILGGGALCSLGCIIVILVGPYYFGIYLTTEASYVIFWIGCALSGLGMVPIGFKCGELYGALSPRRTILYTGLSGLALGFICFLTLGAPLWHPIPGGPTLVSIIVFCGLPFLAALAAALSLVPPKPTDKSVAYHETRKALPRAFWKLVIVTFVFATVISALRSVGVLISEVAVTLGNFRIALLLRMLVALVFVIVSINAEGRGIRFGKIYAVIMAAAVIFIALCPFIGVLHVAWTQAITFTFYIYEFVFWCILAFIIYQRRISPILVFGYGYGIYMLGSGIGWLVGSSSFLEDVIISGDYLPYLIIAIVVVICAFVLFSEKDFDKLFEPAEEDGSSLDELLQEDLSEHPEPETAPRKGHFNEAIDHLVEQYRLSRRESDVLRCLAMGYSATATSERLGIAWNTVRTHTSSIYAKMGVHSRQELIEMVDVATKKIA